MMLNQDQPPLGPLWAIGGHFRMWAPDPLNPRKRTCAVQLDMSAKCQKRTSLTSDLALKCGSCEVGPVALIKRALVGAPNWGTPSRGLMVGIVSLSTSRFSVTYPPG